MGKRGPKSCRERAEKPRRMGMKARMVWRTTTMKSKHTIKVYRAGWNLMWRYSRELLESWGVPVPGAYSKTSQLGGLMPATPQEFRKSPITGPRLALCLEDAYEQGVTLSNLKNMRKTCSFLHHLKTGKSGKNFEIVDGMMESLNPAGCGVQKRFLKPTKIATPEELKTAFTREWRGPQSGMTLVEFTQGVVSGWHWCVLGCRSGEDLKRIKESEVHFVDAENGTWAVSFVNGRCKLPMHKSGNRPWNAWAICLCPNADHRPPEGFYLNNSGNPIGVLPAGLCTTCPLFAWQLMERYQSNHFRCYKKWTVRGRFGKGDQGSVVNLARSWFAYQGVMQWEDPFHSNSGRKALAGWLDLLDVPYEQSVHIHGDLPDIWREHYQPRMLPCSANIREQSPDAQLATAALRSLREYFDRHPPPPPPPPGVQTPADMCTIMLMDRLGMGKTARAIYGAAQG